MKFQITKHCLILALALLSLCFSRGAWAQFFELESPQITSRTLHASGTLVDLHGYKVSWKSPQIDGIVKTKFIYVKSPEVKIYLPQSILPLSIKANHLSIDSDNKCYFFKENVTIQMKKGILKTNFLKINLSKLEASSFDKYTFFQKNNSKILKGQSFYGNAKSQSFQLFNVQNNKGGSLLNLPFI